MTRRARARREEGELGSQARCKSVLFSLENDPFPAGCKKLKNRDGWRGRVGDYRILYFADKAAREVIVGVIAHRRDVYRR